MTALLKITPHVTKFCKTRYIVVCVDHQ